MTEQTQPIRNTADKPAKKSYEPPRILSHERLEAVAALCNVGKINEGSCPGGPINS